LKESLPRLLTVSKKIIHLVKEILPMIRSSQNLFPNSELLLMSRSHLLLFLTTQQTIASFTIHLLQKMILRSQLRSMREPRSKMMN
jgi:hypothetical protein